MEGLAERGVKVERIYLPEYHTTEDSQLDIVTKTKVGAHLYR